MHKFFITIALAVGIAASLTTTIAEADYMPPKVLGVTETINLYAGIYGVPKHELLAVSFCESSYNQQSIGDHGLALGIFQYHKTTFDTFSKLMGEKLDYYSYTDQAKLTAWIWKYHPEYKKHWTCASKNGFV